jgi:hypothetical protein
MCAVQTVVRSILLCAEHCYAQYTAVRTAQYTAVRRAHCAVYCCAQCKLLWAVQAVVRSARCCAQYTVACRIVLCTVNCCVHTAMYATVCRCCAHTAMLTCAVYCCAQCILVCTVHTAERSIHSCSQFRPYNAVCSMHFCAPHYTAVRQAC